MPVPSKMKHNWVYLWGLAAAPFALAQNSGLSGHITDPQGAAVRNAEVQVFNKGTKVLLKAWTDAVGNYIVPYLADGHYRVEIHAPGFSLAVIDDVPLEQGRIVVYNVQLHIETVKAEVGVQVGGAAQVDTETSEVFGKITEKEVVSYGLNGRNFSQLSALAPGVSNQTGQDEAQVGVLGSVKYSVNGGRVEYNSFQVDGSNVLNTGLNKASSTLMVYPSLDAIQEVKVLTSNYAAAYGRSASGIVQVITKSGGNRFHGNVYEFLRNEDFNARNYFDQTKSAPLYRRNDFGGTLGGPLVIPHLYNIGKTKTFFFFSEEFRLEKTPTDFNQAVPSLKERGLIATANGLQPNLVADSNGVLRQAFDFTDVCPLPASPAFLGFSRQQYPDCPARPSASPLLVPYTSNFLPAVDKNSLLMLHSNLIPLPNSPVGCSYRVVNVDPSDPNHCYDVTLSPYTYWREELLRLDHNISNNLKLTVHYIHDSWDTTVLTPQWGAVRNSFPTVENRFFGPGTSVAVRMTQTISNNLLNQILASYVNSKITLADENGPGNAAVARNPQLDQPLLPDPSVPGQCNPLISVNPVTLLPQCGMGHLFNNGFGGKMPGLVFQGTNVAYGGEGFAVDPAYMPWAHTSPTYSVRDDFTKAWGAHILQFGVEAILAQRNQTNNAIGPATGDLQGLLTFSNLTKSTGNAFADFLIQDSAANSSRPQEYIQSFTQDSAQGRYYQRYEIGEPYLQDDWRVNPRLTLNLGLRVSLFGTYSEKNHNAWNWVPSKFNRSAFAVDPASGVLLDATGSTPVPVLLDSNNQLPALVIRNLGFVQCGVHGVPAGCMQGHLFNPAPRVGFAWDPLGKGTTAIRGGYGIFFEHGTGNEANTGSLEASPPVVLNMTQNYPLSYACIGNIGEGPAFDPSHKFCQIGQAAPPMPGAAFPLNVTSIPTQAVWSNAQQWSFGIERQLKQGTVATVAYVGSKGTHLTVARQLNQIPPLSSSENPFGTNEPITESDCTFAGNAHPGDLANHPFTLQNGTIVTSQDPAYPHLRAACASNFTPNINSLPRPYPGMGRIFALENGADSIYHAVQATLRHTSGPLNVGISYTYGHSIDDSSDRSDPVLVNSYDLRGNRASSSFDERHLANVSYVYQLPNLRRLLNAVTPTLKDDDSTSDGNGRDSQTPAVVSPPTRAPSRLSRILLEDWELSGITIFQSGTPFSVINSASNTGISVTDNAGVSSGLGIAPSFPDVVRGLPSPGNNARSFGPLLGNPSQFVAPRGLTFGDAGRNILNNPDRLNFDMALLKHFRLSEVGLLEFRAEAFNIFNHTQFRVYDPDNPGSSGNNVISCYAGPIYSAGYISPGGADCITGAAFLHPINAHRPRTLQLAMKLSF